MVAMEILSGLVKAVRERTSDQQSTSAQALARSVLIQIAL